MERVLVRCWPLQLPSGDGRLEGGHFITYPDGFGGHDLLTCTGCGHLYALDVDNRANADRSVFQIAGDRACVSCGKSLADTLQAYPETYLDKSGRILRHKRQTILPADSESVVREFDSIG